MPAPTTPPNRYQETMQLLENLHSPQLPADVPFMVSAPGKVILYGEHAVVYGKPAIAAAIGLRSYLLVSPSAQVSFSQSPTITLRCPDIDLDHTWNADSLPWLAASAPDTPRKNAVLNPTTSLSSALLSAIQPHLTPLNTSHPSQTLKYRLSSSTAFLYLLLTLPPPRNTSWTYTLRSTLPINAGLGSSASVSVCIATALLLQSHCIAPPGKAIPNADLHRINTHAFLAEMCIHGTPSGVDNTISTYGSAAYFRRPAYGAPPAIEGISQLPSLGLLLVDTRTGRSTAAQVEKVRALREKNPVVVDAVLRAVGCVVETAYSLLWATGRGKEGFGASELVERLGGLMQVNHGLLGTLGVGHKRLERVREVVEEEEVGWVKLTGAGGGGCAICLVRGDVETKGLGIEGRKVSGVEERLKAEGFGVFRTKVGGEGVGLMMLAQGDGSERGERGYRGCIDQDSFVGAAGKEELEELVGLGPPSKRGKQVEWKFWTEGGPDDSADVKAWWK